MTIENRIAQSPDKVAGDSQVSNPKLFAAGYPTDATRVSDKTPEAVPAVDQFAALNDHLISLKARIDALPQEYRDQVHSVLFAPTKDKDGQASLAYIRQVVC